MPRSPSLDQVLAWCEEHDQHPAEGWLLLLLHGTLSVVELRAAILEKRSPRVESANEARSRTDEKLWAEHLALLRAHLETCDRLYKLELADIDRRIKAEEDRIAAEEKAETDRLSVFFTPDWSRDGELQVEVQTEDGECLDCWGLPLPPEGRTGEKISAMVRPTLDKLCGVASANTERTG